MNTDIGDFPDDSVVKKPTYNAGVRDSISPGETKTPCVC